MNTNRKDLAARLLVFFGGRPDDLGRFFAASGVDPADVRARIDDPAFQDGLIDYVLANEPLLLAYCEESGDDPAGIARLRQADQSAMWRS